MSDLLEGGGLVKGVLAQQLDSLGQLCLEVGKAAGGVLSTVLTLSFVDQSLQGSAVRVGSQLVLCNVVAVDLELDDGVSIAQCAQSDGQ